MQALGNGQRVLILLAKAGSGIRSRTGLAAAFDETPKKQAGNVDPAAGARKRATAVEERKAVSRSLLGWNGGFGGFRATIRRGQSREGERGGGGIWRASSQARAGHAGGGATVTEVGSEPCRSVSQGVGRMVLSS